PRSVVVFLSRRPARVPIILLSLHYALPILDRLPRNQPLMAGTNERLKKTLSLVIGFFAGCVAGAAAVSLETDDEAQRLFQPLIRDRKSTRLNSSHGSISYAVFCLKKKINNA